MERVSLAQAKARLSELVDRAAAGEILCITRRGKPVAKIVGPDEARPTGKKPPVDLEALRQFTSSMPRQSVSAGEFVRRMRDEDRY